MLFQYRAVDNAGAESAGEREALDRFALARALKSESGLTLVETKEKKATGGGSFMDKLNALFSRVKIKDQIIFAGSLSAMLGAGLSLSRALAVMERQTGNKNFKKIISDVAERVSRGSTLSKALATYNKIFPPVFIAMVAAGEESGNLAGSLETARQQLAKSHDLRRKVKGAMIYPAIIVSVIIVIGILMMIFLVPQLTSLFKDLEVDLPLSTRIVVWTSDFLSTHTLSFVLVFLALVVASWRGLKTRAGKNLFTRVAMKAPAVSTIIKNLNAAVTMRTLSSLVSAGVSLVEAITITTEVIQNPFYREVLKQAVEKIQKGSALSVVFKEHEDIYPILVGEMAEVGEETGNLTGMLLKGATFFEDEVEQATKNLSTLIEPALMVLIGIAVGFFAVSMLGPMYSLSDKI